ncbi:MAG: patatin-like phospholipase family protein [Nocardioidaceae bacterium]
MTQPQSDNSAASLRADLVLEAGGVKGIAFSGVIGELARAGYRFPRVAGTSAGAIAGSVIAALEHAGESPARLLDIAKTLDVSKVPDQGWLGKHLGPLHLVADGASLLFEGGLYEGDYLHTWLTGVLADLGVRTFGDLRRDDPGSALPVDREYSFVAVTSDLSEHRMTLLPWDYRHYGLDPDEQPVADAVSASAAIPFIFEPRKLRTSYGSVSLVDGGVLSGYPITIFDQPPYRPSRWPTVGVRLSAREDSRAADHEVDSGIGVVIAVVETMLEGWDARHISNPASQERTIFVDTSGVSGLDFDITPEQQRELIEDGRAAARRFLGR